MLPRKVIAAAVALVLCMGISAAAATAEQDREPFSPAGCDFEVRFPCEHHVRSPGGDGLPVAVMPGSRSTVEAVCSANYPEGFLQRLSDARIAGFIISLAERAGTAPVRVIKLAEDGVVRMFAVRARDAEAAGDSSGVASLWVYGPHSRLIVEMTPVPDPEGAANSGGSCPLRPDPQEIMNWIVRVD